ncbi:MAG TPA: hypothetical protein ACFYDZ_05535 [Candidatus Brocadiaceae bacterium]
MAETDAEEVSNCFLAGDVYRCGAPINLSGLAWGEGQGGCTPLWIPGPQLGYHTAHRGFGTLKVFLGN